LKEQKEPSLAFGGQAVIEGVMIRSRKHMVICVKQPNKQMLKKVEEIKSISEKHKILRAPFLRGIVALLETLYLGIKGLLFSANANLEEEKLSTKEAALTVVFAFALAIFLFTLLPFFLTTFLSETLNLSGTPFYVVESIIRIGIFLAYLAFISSIAEFRRVLQYHGAEHIAINAYEAGVDITVKDIIIAAIMAGCKPNAIPVVVTAFQALTDPRYNFLQSVHTSFPGGNLVLVSGPIAKEVGLWGGQGCIGPGPWTNGPIGRAVNLVLINRLRCIPGADDLDCLASPAEFTYCFAEESGIGPWPTINEELYDKDTTTVLVLKAENPHDIIEFMCQTASDFLVSLVDCCTTLGSNNAYMPSSLIVVLTPDHAKLLAKDGWTKQKLKEYIHTWVANPLPMIRNRGLSPARPKGFENKHPMPVTRSPDDIWIVVAGGRGGHSCRSCEPYGGSRGHSRVSLLAFR